MSRVVFLAANLLDGEHPAVPGRTVVVDGNRIAAVRADGRLVPRDGDRVIDLRGDTLMPGMVQAHWHGSYQGLDFEPPP